MLSQEEKRKIEIENVNKNVEREKEEAKRKPTKLKQVQKIHAFPLYTTAAVAISRII